jgi:hypothetical protein
MHDAHAQRVHIGHEHRLRAFQLPRYSVFIAGLAYLHLCTPSVNPSDFAVSSELAPLTQHSLAGEGVGGANSDNRRGSLAFCKTM